MGIFEDVYAFPYVEQDVSDEVVDEEGNILVNPAWTATLYVAPSKEVPGQLGLFVRHDTAAGTIDRSVDYTDAPIIEDNAYVINRDYLLEINNVVYDASQVNSTMLRFANTSLRKNRCNAEYHYEKDSFGYKHVFVKITKNIKADSEILLSYGTSYENAIRNNIKIQRLIDIANSTPKRKNYRSIFIGTRNYTGQEIAELIDVEKTPCILSQQTLVSGTLRMFVDSVSETLGDTVLIDSLRGKLWQENPRKLDLLVRNMLAYLTG